MPSSVQPSRNPPGETAALIFVIASILVFLAFTVWFWVQAPDTVASHLDSAGRPDGWSSKAGLLGIFVPLGAGVPLLLSIRWIWEKLPVSLVNIPSKDYWLERGERTYLYDCLMQFLRIVGGATALLFASILAAIMRDARSATVPEWMTIVPTVIFLVIVALAVWHLVRRLRPPR